MSDYWDEDNDDDHDCYIPCPECGQEVYDDVEQCPYCRQYIIRSGTNIWKDKPIWWIVLGGLGIVSVILFFTL